MSGTGARRRTDPYLIGGSIVGAVVLSVALFASMVTHKGTGWVVILGTFDVIFAYVWVGWFVAWVIGRSTA